MFRKRSDPTLTLLIPRRPGIQTQHPPPVVNRSLPARLLPAQPEPLFSRPGTANLTSASPDGTTPHHQRFPKAARPPRHSSPNIKPRATRSTPPCLPELLPRSAAIRGQSGRSPKMSDRSRRLPTINLLQCIRSVARQGHLRQRSNPFLGVWAGLSEGRDGRTPVGGFAAEAACSPGTARPWGCARPGPRARGGALARDRGAVGVRSPGPRGRGGWSTSTSSV
jgi:hypothetical protein